MKGVRVGNKKASLSIVKTYPVGPISGNGSPHTAGANRTITGGTPVHGKPLMSDASKKGK